MQAHIPNFIYRYENVFIYVWSIPLELNFWAYL
jgi:hypothetical protein